MRVYFSAEEQCMLRLGGAAAGFCGRAAKFADIGEEGAQAEFLPAGREPAAPLLLYLRRVFPRAARLLHRVPLRLRRGRARALFPARKAAHRARTGAADGVLFTVFGGAMPSLVLENGHGMEIVPLPPAERYEAGRAEIGGESFARLECLHKGERTLLLFNARLEEAFRGQADGAEYGRRLTVTRRLHEHRGAYGRARFPCGDGALVQEERRLRGGRKGSTPRSWTKGCCPLPSFRNCWREATPRPSSPPPSRKRRRCLKNTSAASAAYRSPATYFT